MLIKEKHITRMGVGPLCRLFGKSRQAFYHRKHSFLEKEQQELIVLELVAQVRRELPGLGGHKLYKCIYQPLRTNGIKIGRDKLFTILRNHKLYAWVRGTLLVSLLQLFIDFTTTQGLSLSTFVL